MKKGSAILIFLSICYSSLLSCEEALESPLTQKKVILLAPGDGVTTDADSPINFSWEPLDAATNYRLQIVTPSFNTIELLISDTITSKNLLALSLDTGRYAWRVQALNASSNSIEYDSRILIVK